MWDQLTWMSVTRVICNLNSTSSWWLISFLESRSGVNRNGRLMLQIEGKFHLRRIVWNSVRWKIITAKIKLLSTLNIWTCNESITIEFNATFCSNYPVATYKRLKRIDTGFDSRWTNRYSKKSQQQILLCSKYLRKQWWCFYAVYIGSISSFLANVLKQFCKVFYQIILSAA